MSLTSNPKLAVNICLYRAPCYLLRVTRTGFGQCQKCRQNGNRHDGRIAGHTSRVSTEGTPLNGWCVLSPTVCYYIGSKSMPSCAEFQATPNYIADTFSTVNPDGRSDKPAWEEFVTDVYRLTLARAENKVRTRSTHYAHAPHGRAGA